MHSFNVSFNAVILVQAILEDAGQEIRDANALVMALRTIVVYFATLIIVRLGSRRILGEGTAFDVVVGIMLGSIMSRAINGDTPLLPTLVAGATLVGLHWLIATLSYHFHWIGPIVKGSRHLLIRNGRIREDALREANLSHKDLEEELRLQTGSGDLSTIDRAYLERDGRISFITKERSRRSG